MLMILVFVGEFMFSGTVVKGASPTLRKGNNNGNTREEVDLQATQDCAP